MNFPIAAKFKGEYDKYSFIFNLVYIESVSDLEQAFKLLPANNDVVVHLPEGTTIECFDASESSLYISTKELKDEVLESILENSNNLELFDEGVEVRILEPGNKWVTGKIRFRLAFEFISDEQENNKTPSSTNAVLGGQ